MTGTTIDAARVPTGLHPVARRVARWGFWFFLVKGLAWLATPLAAWHLVG